LLRFDFFAHAKSKRSNQMNKYTRKQHIVDILGDFTSGNMIFPTRVGALHVDLADLAAVARRSLEVRELYHDFLPVDAIVDEASIARALTMFGYVYASLATASSPSNPKLGFPISAVDNIDVLHLPARLPQRLARFNLLFVGDILALEESRLATLGTATEVALIRSKCIDHLDGKYVAKAWPEDGFLPVPPANAARRAHIMQLPIGRTELPASVVDFLRSGSLQTVGDLAKITRADLMQRAKIGPLAVAAIERMLAGIGVELLVVRAVSALPAHIDAW
jgi:hypothetical protein